MALPCRLSVSILSLIDSIVADLKSAHGIDCCQELYIFHIPPLIEKQTNHFPWVSHWWRRLQNQLTLSSITTLLRLPTQIISPLISITATSSGSNLTCADTSRSVLLGSVIIVPPMSRLIVICRYGFLYYILFSTVKQIYCRLC